MCAVCQVKSTMRISFFYSSCDMWESKCVHHMVPVCMTHPITLNGELGQCDIKLRKIMLKFGFTSLFLCYEVCKVDKYAIVGPFVLNSFQLGTFVACHNSFNIQNIQCLRVTKYSAVVMKWYFLCFPLSVPK